MPQVCAQTAVHLVNMLRAINIVVAARYSFGEMIVRIIVFAVVQNSERGLKGARLRLN